MQVRRNGISELSGGEEKWNIGILEVALSAGEEKCNIGLLELSGGEEKWNIRMRIVGIEKITMRRI